MGTVAIGIGIGIGLGSVERVLHIFIEPNFIGIGIGVGVGIEVGQWKHTNMGNKRAVRILLECILVGLKFFGLRKGYLY